MEISNHMCIKAQIKEEHGLKISNNLPERGSSYAIAEDHVSSELLFVGTEFGVFLLE